MLPNFVLLVLGKLRNVCYFEWIGIVAQAINSVLYRVGVTLSSLRFSHSEKNRRRLSYWLLCMRRATNLISITCCCRIIDLIDKKGIQIRAASAHTRRLTLFLEQKKERTNPWVRSSTLLTKWILCYSQNSGVARTQKCYFIRTYFEMYTYITSKSNVSHKKCKMFCPSLPPNKKGVDEKYWSCSFSRCNFNLFLSLDSHS